VRLRGSQSENQAAEDKDRLKSPRELDMIHDFIISSCLSALYLYLFFRCYGTKHKENLFNRSHPFTNYKKDKL
jgi:hypothetical protein